jgi:hypothetical protein
MWLVEVALRTAIRYDPARSGNGYKPESYLWDVLAQRLPDFYRRKSEGFGDRRYGNDSRIVLSAMDDDQPDLDSLDFEKLMSARRVARWQRAADAAGWQLSEFICISVDRASREVLASAGEA